MTSAAIAPRAETAFDVPIRPAALAQVWTGPGKPHECIAVPGVALDRGEVLVAVELATICGSDVHTVSGHRATPTPTILGHEYVGRVVAIGSDSIRSVDGATVRIGNRIVWSVFAACQRCDRCRQGIPQKCRELLKYGHERVSQRWELNGGFATHVHGRAGTTIARVPEQLAADVLAPASCATATAAAALRSASEVVDLEGAVVVISGAGLIGLTVAAMAVDEGATVIVRDPEPRRRELASRFGAAATWDPTGSQPLTQLLASGGWGDPTAIIEASGARSAVRAAFGNVGVGGAVILVGSVFATEPVPLDPEQVVRRCLTLRGVHNYAPRDLARAVQFLRERHARYPFASLVGEAFALDQIDQAIRRAADGAHVRVAIRPR